MIDAAPILADMRENGHSILPGLTKEQVADVTGWLKSRPVYPDLHVRYNAGPQGTWAQYAGKELLCQHNHDVLRAPHLLEYALALTDVAAGFLGREPPVLYSCNVFWSRPGSYLRQDIQAFHPDTDDVRFLPLFIFLTDVLKPGDGAQEIQYAGKPTAQIKGPAGTAFFSDTAHPHRGLKPTSGERGIVWFRWGVSDVPPAYQWDRLEPMKKYKLGDRYPTDPRLQDSIKLMVA